jgi:hypothetical protein
MSHGAIDIEKLRVALRRMSRGNLLIVAERAIEIAPRAKLRQLFGDMVRLDKLSEGKPGAAPLLDEVRKFREASLRGEYYDSFDVRYRPTPPPPSSWPRDSPEREVLENAALALTREYCEWMCKSATEAHAASRQIRQWIVFIA